VVAAVEPGGVVAAAQRTCVLKATGAQVGEMRRTRWRGQTPKASRGPGPPWTILYFLLPALAAPGFGLAAELDSGAAVFFLSALGFLGSQLLLF
jgi:hypothetical protein